MIFVVSMCLKFANARPFHSGSTQSFSGLWSYNYAKEDLYEINFCQIIHCMLVRKRAVDGP